MRVQGLLLWPLLVTAAAGAAQPAAEQQGTKCGGHLERCCPACPPDLRTQDCDQYECSGGRSCYQFGVKGVTMPDGTRNQPMMCLQTPPTCGKLDGPCCFSSDPSSELERCAPGLTCIVSRVGYGDPAMYYALMSSPGKLNSTELMGVCKKLTDKDCGKRYFPCGAAGRRLGCDETTLQCGPDDFCASPGDTMLAAPRCLPMPVRCGQLNNACCPANKDAVVRERWLMDGVTPVPFCTGNSFCIWQVKDYAKQGLQQLNAAGGARQLMWDGYFQRGYGQSRCLALPAACGNPGEACCPSMIDQRLSGMVHNKKFKYQPCNYNAGSRTGIFCKGTWQSELLLPGAALGTCTLNEPDCGKLGKQCCREDVPEVGPLAMCESQSAPGSHFCDAANVCTKCSAAPKSAEEKKQCGMQAVVAQEQGQSARGRGRG